MMTPCISVDWLSLFVNAYGSPCLNLEEYVYTAGPWQCELTDKRSASFDAIHTLSYRGVPFATLQSHPHSKLISECAGVLKIENACLYLQSWQNLLTDCLSIFRLRILSVSRIDVCLDTERIAGGSLNAFAKRILANEIIRQGSRSFFAVAKDPTTIRGVTQTRSRVRGGHGYVVQTDLQVRRDKNVIEYICWGSRRSDVRLYFYDKTAELHDVKTKPWITQMWRSAGWNGSSDVFRSEFSVQGSRLVEKAVGDLRLSLYHLLLARDYASVFFSLAGKYGRFAINDAPRFDRCTPFEVFPPRPDCLQLSIACKQSMRGAGLSDKIALRRMFELLPSMPSDLQSSFSRWANGYLIDTELAEWSSKAGIHFNALREEQPHDELKPRPWFRGENIFIGENEHPFTLRSRADLDVDSNQFHLSFEGSDI